MFEDVRVLLRAARHVHDSDLLAFLEKDPLSRRLLDFVVQTLADIGT